MSEAPIPQFARDEIWRRAELPGMDHIMGPPEFGDDRRTCTKCGRVVVKQPNGDWAGSALTRECGDVIDRRAAIAATQALEAVRRGTSE